jgi:hypothetical protein
MFLKTVNGINSVCFECALMFLRIFEKLLVLKLKLLDCLLNYFRTLKILSEAIVILSTPSVVDNSLVHFLSRNSGKTQRWRSDGIFKITMSFQGLVWKSKINVFDPACIRI